MYVNVLILLGGMKQFLKQKHHILSQYQGILWEVVENYENLNYKQYTGGQSTCCCCFMCRQPSLHHEILIFINIYGFSGGWVSLFKFQLQVGIARGGGVFFQISISGWYQYQFGGWWVHRSNFQNYINQGPGLVFRFRTPPD